MNAVRHTAIRYELVMVTIVVHFVWLFLMLARGSTGLATNFWPYGDPGNPDAHAACLHRDLRRTDVVVAHRRLPCGESVLIYLPRTGRSVVATVGDRGPAHAMVDLAPATTRALRANGMERVLMLPLGGTP